MRRWTRMAMALAPGFLVLASCAEDNTPAEPVTGSDQYLAAEAAAAANSWTAKPAMPTGRVGLAAAVVNNSLDQAVLYAIGGDDGAGRTLSAVEAFNLVTNTWSAKAPLPAKLEETNGAVVIAGKIYVSGGRDLDNNSPGSDDGYPRKSLYVYDQASDSWSRKADMPAPSMFGVSGAINGKLYVLNGWLNQLYRYDPAADTWAILPSCPGIHSSAAAAVLNDKLYVAGGVRYTADGPSAIRRLHVYDPFTNRWSEKAGLPHAVYSAAGARLLGQFYVIGGIAGAHGRDFVQAYEPVANTWTLKAHLPTFRLGLAASHFVNPNGRGRIVAIGGYGGLGARWLKSNDVYTP